MMRLSMSEWYEDIERDRGRFTSIYPSVAAREQAKNARKRAKRLPRQWADRIIVGGHDECWSWSGSHNANGYPMVMRTSARKGGKPERVHRLVAEIAHGDCPSHVHHICENRSCVNPKHLLPTASQAEHIALHRHG